MFTTSNNKSDAYTRKSNLDQFEKHLSLTGDECVCVCGVRCVDRGRKRVGKQNYKIDLITPAGN